MKFPKRTSRQSKVLRALMKNFQQSKYCWMLDAPGIPHHQFAPDVRALRQKGWPIEDTPERTPGIGVRHAYRLDPERFEVQEAWKSLLS